MSEYPAYDLDKRTGEPQRLLGALDPRALFGSLAPLTKKRCRCAYLQGRIDALESLGRDAANERRLLEALEESA